MSDKKLWETKRVFESPVNIGDTVYILAKYNGETYGIKEDIVQMVGFTRAGIRIRCRNNNEFNKDYMFGKSAFLSLNEAIEFNSK